MRLLLNVSQSLLETRTASARLDGYNYAGKVPRIIAGQDAKNSSLSGSRLN